MIKIDSSLISSDGLNPHQGRLKPQKNGNHPVPVSDDLTAVFSTKLSTIQESIR